MMEQRHDNKGKSILLIMNVPPPYQGTTITNKHILDILEDEKIDHIHFKVESSKELSEIGKFSMRKFTGAASLLYKILKHRKKYDMAFLIMSVNGIAFYRHASFILLLQLLGKKCVLHLQGLGFQYKTGVGAWLTRIIFKRAYIIQHSPFNKFDIEKYPCRKVYYMPNGVDDDYEKYKPKIEAHRQQQSKATNIVFLSNLIADKGIFVAIEAARIIQEKAGNDKLNLRWNFIGKWKNEETRDKFFGYIKQHSLEQYIDHMGPLYNEDKFLRLADMDVQIFPTFYKHETWGNVVLEGMMFKLPVVASDYVAIPEMVKNDLTGFLVPKQDAQALADRIIWMAGNPERRRTMGEEGRKLYLDKFTLLALRKNILGIFNDVRS